MSEHAMTCLDAVKAGRWTPTNAITLLEGRMAMSQDTFEIYGSLNAGMTGSLLFIFLKPRNHLPIP